MMLLMLNSANILNATPMEQHLSLEKALIVVIKALSVLMKSKERYNRHDLLLIYPYNDRIKWFMRFSREIMVYV